MVSDQYADFTFFKKTDDFLNIEHGDRVDPGEGLVKQDEPRIGGQGPRYFGATTFAAR